MKNLIALMSLVIMVGTTFADISDYIGAIQSKLDDIKKTGAEYNAKKLSTSDKLKLWASCHDSALFDRYQVVVRTCGNGDANRTYVMCNEDERETMYNMFIENTCGERPYVYSFHYSNNYPALDKYSAIAIDFNSNKIIKIEK